ncbi:MAG: AMP-binding protein, partial [Clostridiales bacterium]|nr:AMP-binding protein [Clostridiales bacterium]
SFYPVRQFDNIRQMMDQSVQLYGERTAFEVKTDKETTRNITFNEYIGDINALSTYFCSLGDKSEFIAVCGDNCYEYCLTYLSAVCAGKVIVPIDRELHAEDILGIIAACDAKVLICDKKIHRDIHSFLPSDMIVLTFSGDCGEMTVDEAVKEGNELIESGKPLYCQVMQDPEKMCTLLFTSGTTGTSKGVMLCQRNFCFEVKAAMGVLKITPDDCEISLLPIHHTFESCIVLFFAPYCGAKITFCDGFKYVLRNMKEFEPTVFVAVPMILEIVHKRIMNEIKKRKNGERFFKIGKSLCKVASKVHIDLRKVIFKEIQNTFGGKLRMIICGGAAIDPQIIKDFDSFGIQIVYGYGLTECAPLAIINHDRLRTTDSIGRPLPGVESKLIDVDSSGVGELCVKGGMVMLGYYNNREETEKVIDPDGFFHTGDLAFIDRRGCYHITGRCKNVIVTSNGKNIYPEELEYHLDINDIINSSLVEGVENKKGVTEIHAQIYPEMSMFSSIENEEEREKTIFAAVKSVVDSVNAALPGFKKIKSFTVRKDDFERTTTRKIKRNADGNKRKFRQKKADRKSDKSASGEKD